MNRRGADRSGWIAQALRARKPSVSGEILVSRDGGGYRVEHRFEEEPGVFARLPVARLLPNDAGWRIEWTSGNGIWKPLDERGRSLDEAIDAIVRDDFGCFFG